MGGYSNYDAKGTLIWNQPPVLCKEEKMVDKTQLLEAVFSHVHVVWSQMFRASFVKGGLFRFDERWTYGEDTIFTYQCVLATKRIKLIPQCGYRRIVNKGSAIHVYQACLYDSEMTILRYLRQILKQTDLSDEERGLIVRRRRYRKTHVFLSNFFLPHCPLKYSEKVREVRRIVFEDPDMPDVMRKEDRKGHGIYNRFVFDVAYDLHSPQLIAFVFRFLNPVVKFWREHIKVLLRRQPSN